MVMPVATTMAPPPVSEVATWTRSRRLDGTGGDARRTMARTPGPAQDRRGAWHTPTPRRTSRSSA